MATWINFHNVQKTKGTVGTLGSRSVPGLLQIGKQRSGGEPVNETDSTGTIYVSSAGELLFKYENQEPRRLDVEPSVTTASSNMANVITNTVLPGGPGLDIGSGLAEFNSMYAINFFGDLFSGDQLIIREPNTFKNYIYASNVSGTANLILGASDRFWEGYFDELTVVETGNVNATALVANATTLQLGDADNPQAKVYSDGLLITNAANTTVLEAQNGDYSLGNPTDRWDIYARGLKVENDLGQTQLHFSADGSINQLGSNSFVLSSTFDKIYIFDGATLEFAHDSATKIIGNPATMSWDAYFANINVGNTLVSNATVKQLGNSTVLFDAFLGNLVVSNIANLTATEAFVGTTSDPVNLVSDNLVVVGDEFVANATVNRLGNSGTRAWDLWGNLLVVDNLDTSTHTLGNATVGWGIYADSLINANLNTVTTQLGNATVRWDLWGNLLVVDNLDTSTHTLGNATVGWGIYADSLINANLNTVTTQLGNATVGWGIYADSLINANLNTVTTQLGNATVEWDVYANSIVSSNLNTNTRQLGNSTVLWDVYADTLRADGFFAGFDDANVVIKHELSGGAWVINAANIVTPTMNSESRQLGNLTAGWVVYGDSLINANLNTVTTQLGNATVEWDAYLNDLYHSNINTSTLTMGDSWTIGAREVIVKDDFGNTTFQVLGDGSTSQLGSVSKPWSIFADSMQLLVAGNVALEHNATTQNLGSANVGWAVWADSLVNANLNTVTTQLGNATVAWDVYANSIVNANLDTSTTQLGNATVAWSGWFGNLTVKDVAGDTMVAATDDNVTRDYRLGTDAKPDWVIRANDVKVGDHLVAPASGVGKLGSTSQRYDVTAREIDIESHLNNVAMRANGYLTTPVYKLGDVGVHWDGRFSNVGVNTDDMETYSMKVVGDSKFTGNLVLDRIRDLKVLNDTTAGYCYHDGSGNIDWITGNIGGGGGGGTAIPTSAPLGRSIINKYLGPFEIANTNINLGEQLISEDTGLTDPALLTGFTPDFTSVWVAPFTGKFLNVTVSSDTADGVEFYIVNYSSSRYRSYTIASLNSFNANTYQYVIPDLELETSLPQTGQDFSLVGFFSGSDTMAFGYKSLVGSANVKVDYSIFDLSFEGGTTLYYSAGAVSLSDNNYYLGLDYNFHNFASSNVDFGTNLAQIPFTIPLAAPFNGQFRSVTLTCQEDVPVELVICNLTTASFRIYSIPTIRQSGSIYTETIADLSNVNNIDNPGVTESMHPYTNAGSFNQGELIAFGFRTTKTIDSNDEATWFNCSFKWSLNEIA